jgi:hypothetical protein
MFEKASKLKIRFASSKGKLTVEDLWDLPLSSNRDDVVSLDSIAIELNRKIKDNDEESFVVKRSPTRNTLDLKFEIVKHIIKVRLSDIAKNEQRTANAERKAKIISIIAEKQDDSLRNMSLEDLRKEVASL